MLMQYDHDMMSLLYARRAAGLAPPRIHSILRTKNDLFFKRPSDMPNQYVDNWDRYQHGHDFKNDLKRTVFIPFASLHLASLHLSKAVLDLVSGLLDYLFLDVDVKKKALGNMLLSGVCELGLSIAYHVLAVIYTLDSLLDIAFRASISLVSESIEGINALMRKKKPEPEIVLAMAAPAA